MNNDNDTKKDDSYEVELDSFSTNFNCGFDKVRISLATADDIYAISKGEVVKTDTLNYRTLKPEKGGIFCASIFGPTEDYKCSCRRYIGEAYKGLRCERCNVLIGSRRTRRLFFGHIDLNTCVVHPWFYNYVCAILKMAKKLFNSIITFESFVFVENTSDGCYCIGDVVTAEKYYTELFVYGDAVKSGGEAIYMLLGMIDCEEEYKLLNNTMKNCTLSELSEKDIKRRDILYCFVKNKTSPQSFIISVVPIIPAEVRPIIVCLEGGGIATMDINELYRKIISRNNRLYKLIKLETHRIIINNEKYMLNQAIAQLMGPQKHRSNKSISEYIKGKKGYFRRALLGKRTDFSGRGAIVIGPELEIGECSIPVTIAIEIFKPFIYSVILRRKYAHSIIEAKRIVDDRVSIVFKILSEVVKDFPIILNRAPTLHRLGIQAFSIKLSNEQAIRIAPLVCTGYNADFDGDQMAAHLPISIAARIECYSMMFATNNLFLPSSGRLILMPSKDIVMGIYYLTSEGYNKQHMLIAQEDICHLTYNNTIYMQTVIRGVVHDNKGQRIVVTTCGRLSIWNCITNKDKLSFDVFNCCYDKTVINNIIMYIFYNNGWQAALDLLNQLTTLGFTAITQSGISYSEQDMPEWPRRQESIDEVEQQNLELQKYYAQGVITREELDTGAINAWYKLINFSADDIIEYMCTYEYNASDVSGVLRNNIYLMYISGARGSRSQIQQVCCIRGFMAKPSGQMSTFVIKSHLRKGLKSLELFDSTHGERKGLSDVAVKTSKSGHFTRRLVDVAHSIYVDEDDCGTEQYMEINRLYDRRNYNFSIHDAIFGRVLAKDVYSNKNDMCIATKGTIIDHMVYDKIVEAQVVTIAIYSVMYCKSSRVCRKCYGLDFALHKSVHIGTPVGIIAAQSIGEPGTQLTLRATHTGGIATASDSTTCISAESDGILDLTDIDYAVNSNNEIVVIIDGSVNILDVDTHAVLETIDLKKGTIIKHEDKSRIYVGDIIAYRHLNVKQIIAINDGVVHYNKFIKGVNYNIVLDEETGITSKKIIYALRMAEENIYPYISIVGDNTINYDIEDGMYISVKEGKEVKRGDVIARLFNKSTYVKDITGGLPKIIDIFEVKKSINKSIIATHNGIVKITSSLGARKNRCISIVDENNRVLYKCHISKNKHIAVQNESYVKRGMCIIDGELYLQDLLDSMGYHYTIKHIIGEIAIIYEDQGVNINYKHFEVIIRQMMRRGVVLYQGESNYVVGSVIEYSDLQKERDALIKKYGENIKFSFKRVINGITKVALNYHNSFISSSSFQHTISILAYAAISCAEDDMKGVKENVIFGKRIPIGTGYKPFILKCNNEN